MLYFDHSATTPIHPEVAQKINYIKINIFPDGGISRIRAFGRVD